MATIETEYRNRLKRKKLFLILLIVLVGSSSALYATFAYFNAQTRNPNDSFSSGTLVLSNTANSGTACLSTAGGTTDTNVNNACDQLLAVTVKKPGDTATGRLVLKNDGTIDGSQLSLYTNSCVTSDATGETYHGTGDLCAQLQLNVQAYSDATYSTKTSCLYGGGTATVCDYSDTTKTVGAFATAFPSGTPKNLGPLTAGSSVYYEVQVNFPTSSDNTYQGRTAAFDATWVLNQ